MKAIITTAAILAALALPAHAAGPKGGMPNPDFTKSLMIKKANCVRETITSIKASTNSPELIGMK